MTATIDKLLTNSQKSPLVRIFLTYWFIFSKFPIENKCWSFKTFFAQCKSSTMDDLWMVLFRYWLVIFIIYFVLGVFDLILEAWEEKHINWFYLSDVFSCMRTRERDNIRIIQSYEIKKTRRWWLLKRVGLVRHHYNDAYATILDH
jgi:hypothetical protein